MTNLDTLYRAFTDFRKITADDHDSAMQRNLVAGTDPNNSFVETVKYTCHIEEDWVNAIEEGMVFVEKAIAEERQFIRNNGEIVPIEKVKRVSRDSVEHLAKHSDLISKEPPEGSPAIPDQLYTVERLSDYAVYENRFLYMLLKYLEQFISLRYNNIVELANTYRGKLGIDKSLKTGRQNITFKVELNEERRNDPLLAELNPNKSIIERIAMLYKMVTHYLTVPLMLEVAKAPLLHPPITVTNVLRMNNNFRGAMRLYEFVSSYDKQGYSAEKQVKKLTPFPDIPADEFAEVEALASYLAYQYGMSVKDILRDAYLKEEERRKEEEEKKKLKKLAALRKKIEETGCSPEEYMLLLESRNRALESDSAHLAEAKIEIERLNGEIDRLDGQVEQLSLLAEDRAAQIVALKAAHENEVAELKASHENEISELNTAHASEVAELNTAHASEIADINAVHADELNAQKQQHIQAMEQVESEHDEQLRQIAESHQAELSGKDDIIGQKEEVIRQKDDTIGSLCAAYEREKENIRAECTATVAQQQRLVNEKDKKLVDALAENKLLAELKTLADARLTAVKFKHGYMTPADDYTSELAFNEIERQYAIFGDFFKRTWRKTKKKIRQDLATKLGAVTAKTQENSDAQQPKGAKKKTSAKKPIEAETPDSIEKPSANKTSSAIEAGGVIENASKAESQPESHIAVQTSENEQNQSDAANVAPKENNDSEKRLRSEQMLKILDILPSGGAIKKHTKPYEKPDEQRESATTSTEIKE